MKNEFKNLLLATLAQYEKVMTSAVDGVYLYGAGFIGRWAVGYLERSGISVLGFVDSDQAKWGTTIEEKQVFSPSDICIQQAKAILITSRHAVRPIAKLLAHLPAAIMSIDALVTHRACEVGLEQIERLLEHDQRSLQTFYAVLSAMLAGTPHPLAPFAENRPFFDRFGFFNRDQEIFVDAGAYVGDSLERFIWSVNGVFRHIHAFEPGPAQFKALKNRTQRLRKEWALSAESISLVNKGLSKNNRIALVNNTKNLIQMTVNDIDTTHSSTSINIETTSLDSYFNKNQYTFLKVDIEGSESDLLHGAQKTINKYRPRVALSVYHYPTDIFELPLQLYHMNEDYLLYLGHHSSQLMDTVLYAKDKNE